MRPDYAKEIARRALTHSGYDTDLLRETIRYSFGELCKRCSYPDLDALVNELREQIDGGDHA